VPRWLTIALVVTAVVLALVGGAVAWFEWRQGRDPAQLAFEAHCAACHGADLAGTDAGPALVEAPLRHGDDTIALIASIAAGYPERGMPGFGEELPAETVKALALYVGERRRDYPSLEDSFVLALPDGVVRSTHHAFRVERVATLESLPYAIAPLPDGRVLVTEKIRGLSVVDPAGTVTLVPGTPEVFPPFLSAGGGYIALGTMLDVALPPDHGATGWIHLSYTERCQLDCGSAVPQSMVRVVRGRLRDGRWVDEQTVWAAPKSKYTVVPDRVAAGRLAFDDAGHVYVSIGGKATYDRVQDLDWPTGKIHRVRRDGTVPEGNPFFVPETERDPDSTRHTVFSFGHRTPQGLAGHPRTGEIWGTEMGPRGGDEVNRIVAGGNYGWPLYTNGLDYDGTPITIGEDLGLDFAYEETVAPVVDFTPAPALSAFTFHRGEAFPAWGEDLLVGTLKAKTLLRLRIEDGVLVEQEALLTDLARIRDVAMGPEGSVYLLLEHGEGGSIVRLVPAGTEAGREIVVAQKPAKSST
jgi:glucose/arabinose dehydrogenase